MNKILAVVVTYNRVSMLKECIKHLLSQCYKNFDILIVDNASTDGTKEFIQSISLNVIYKRLEKNIGGAGGFNYGMRYAVEHHYEYCWIMDDDTYAKKDALSELVRANEELQGKYGYLASRVLWLDEKDCVMNMPRITPYRDISGYDKNYVNIVMSSFVSMFIPCKSIKRYGLPIKDFFIWSDDWEYTRRISKKENCYAVKNSCVIHAMKNPLPVNIATDSEDRLPRYQYFYRNDVYLYRREGLKGWCWLISKDLWHSIQVLAKSKSNKSKRLHIIWSSFRKGKKFFPPIEYVNVNS